MTRPSATRRSCSGRWLPGLEGSASIDAPPEDYAAACGGAPSAGSGRSLKGLRVAWSGDLRYGLADLEVRAIAEAAAKRFTAFGCTLEEDAYLAEPEGAPRRSTSEPGRAPDRAVRGAPGPDRGDAAMIQNAKKVSALDHSKALLQRTVLYEHAHRFFETYDLLLTPQMPVGAWSKEPAPRKARARSAADRRRRCSIGCRSPTRST